MIRYCCISTKVLLFVALLALPSVFAYGNRPEDYNGQKTAAGLKGTNTKNTQVNYWQKLEPNKLNQARNPNSPQCYNPSTNSGLFTDCRPFQSHDYPANEAVCRCSKCNQVTFRLLCFEGTWYLHPDVYKFPCSNCDTNCNVQSAQKFKCADPSVGKIGDFRTCICTEDCFEYVLECTASANWVQKASSVSNMAKVQCNSQPKNVYLEDKDMEYHRGLITVTCKDGFKTQGHNVVACRNGELNATIPQCVPLSPGGFGGFGGVDQSNIDENYNPDDPFNNNPNNPSFPYNPNNPSNPNYNPNNPSNPNKPSNPNFNSNNPSNPNYNPNNPLNPNNPSKPNDPNYNPFNPSNGFTQDYLDNPYVNPTRNPYDGPLLHLPTTKGPRGPHSGPLSGAAPTSASVTSNKPKGRNFNYMYVLYAALAILAIVALVVLVYAFRRYRNSREALIEGGMVEKHEGKASYAAKK